MQKDELFHTLLQEITENPWYLIPHLPALYCGAESDMEPTGRIHISRQSCYLLLYTVSGNGILLQSHQTCFLKSDSLLLLDLQEDCDLQAASCGWKIRWFCLRKEEICGYYTSVYQGKPLILNLPVSSDIPGYIEHLMEEFPIHTPEQAITASKWIGNILSEFTLAFLTDSAVSIRIPDYLQEMKQIMDNSFEVPYKLEDFEKRFMISSARICREFSRYYQLPPLQYLNHLRMEAAKDLLVTTSMPVYEIGNAVGIENTTHFIHLFKKNTGVTPLIFRQNTPDCVRRLHFKKGIPQA